MIEILNRMALWIGYCILGWYTLKFVWFLISVPRIFPKGIDKHEPEMGAYYTKYVFTTIPWIPRKVWRRIVGPFYLRIPIRWADRDTGQRLLAKLVKEAADKAGMTVDAWEAAYSNPEYKPKFIAAAHQVAAARGVTYRDILDNDLMGLSSEALWDKE